MSSMYDPPTRPRSGPSGWLVRAVTVLVIWGTIVVAGWFLVSWMFGAGLRNKPAGNPPGADANAGAAGGGSAAPGNPSGPAVPDASQGRKAAGGNVIEFGIAYGTEKERWLRWAAEEFAKTPAGARIRPKLMGMGSLEGANAIIDGNEAIHVWSPASSIYRPTFEEEWQLRHSGAPILKEQELALTPMVFVMWKNRYDAFIAKYGELNFRTIHEGLQSPGGWGGIANQPEWGFLKFSHTNPAQSNSGLMTLVLMAYDFQNKRGNLSTADVMDPKFLTWMEEMKRGVTRMLDSTGNLMRDMVLRGPSTYDVIFVYEAVVIDYLKNAQGRWSDLQVVYPQANIWNNNPYYILNVPWSSEPQRRAAEEFLAFLMSEPVQRKSLDHGFRPGNSDVGLRFPESPFIRYESSGLKIDVPTVVEDPDSKVLRVLQEAWQRAPGGR